MNKAMSFVQMDFLTIKPYYKTYLIFILVMIAVTFGTQSVSIMCVYVMVSVSMTVSYPFSIGEKNGLDTLYATLSLRKKSVVIGRYAFAVSMELLSVVLTILLLLLSSVILPNTGIAFNEVLIYLSIATLFFSFMTVVQFPVYFKVGYDKAKYIAYLPLAIIFLLSMSASYLIDFFVPEEGIDFFSRVIETYPTLICILTVLAGIVLLLISCAISVRMYSKREI